MQYCKVNPKIKKVSQLIKDDKVGKWQTKPTVEMPQITIDKLINLSK